MALINEGVFRMRCREQSRSHAGYMGMRRWLMNNRNATPEQFSKFLELLYKRPKMIQISPWDIE